jgi:polysaccharide biosynthesis protein PslH
VRIAIVNPIPVHRRAVGGTTRVDALARFLANRHQVTVLAHSSGDPDIDAAAVRDLAASGVTQQLFSLPPRGVRERLTWLTGDEPYFVGYNRNPSLEGELAAVAAKGLDVVHVEYALLFPLLRGAGNAVRVLAEQETMSLAVDRLSRVPLGERSLFEHYLWADRRRIHRFEQAVLPRFDLRYAITSVEAAHMERIARVPVGILPHIVDSGVFVPPPAPEERGALQALFVGSYRHQPNLQALHWFLDQIWPRVRAAVPATKFEIVGPGMPEGHRRRLAAMPGVHLLGWVDDLVSCYHGASVVINPIRSGGGMRGKVLEAFACERAVVSTTMGLEGIAARSGVHCQVADDAADFAAAVVGYLRDPGRRAAHGAAARQVVEQHYRPEAVFSRLEQDYLRAAAAHSRVSA